MLDTLLQRPSLHFTTLHLKIGVHLQYTENTDYVHYKDQSTLFRDILGNYLEFH